ncbi:MAG: DUF2250 domain-containing protein [Thermoproteus sp.]
MNILRKKIYVDILYHLKLAEIDYGKSIARRLERPLDQILKALEDLEAVGLVERVGGHTLKNTKAKMKLSREVRKHHVYYRLSRSGEMLVRCLKRRGPSAYVEALSPEERKALVKACLGAADETPPSLVEMGLLDPRGAPTGLGAAVAALIEPKCGREVNKAPR